MRRDISRRKPVEEGFVPFSFLLIQLLQVLFGTRVKTTKTKNKQTKQKRDTNDMRV